MPALALTGAVSITALPLDPHTLQRVKLRPRRVVVTVAPSIDPTKPTHVRLYACIAISLAVHTCISDDTLELVIDQVTWCIPSRSTPTRRRTRTQTCWLVRGRRWC